MSHPRPCWSFIHHVILYYYINYIISVSYPRCSAFSNNLLTLKSLPNSFLNTLTPLFKDPQVPSYFPLTPVSSHTFHETQSLETWSRGLRSSSSSELVLDGCSSCFWGKSPCSFWQGHPHDSPVLIAQVCTPPQLSLVVANSIIFWMKNVCSHTFLYVLA